MQHRSRSRSRSESKPQEMASGKKKGIGSFFQKVATAPPVATLSQLNAFWIGDCNSTLDGNSDRAMAGDSPSVQAQSCHQRLFEPSALA